MLNAHGDPNEINYQDQVPTAPAMVEIPASQAGRPRRWPARISPASSVSDGDDWLVACLAETAG